jgi:phage terminase large subunit-like protein
VRHPWLVPGLTRAGRVIAFIESLPCTKGYGAGEPLKLLPFQKAWIEAVYAEDGEGVRLVRTAVLSAARGMGKTVLIAALCLCHLVGPEAEPRAEAYSAAATRDQSSLIFHEIEAWVVRVEWLRERLNVKRFGKVIEDLSTGSVYKALASDAPAAHGLAASFIACDELAQWKRRELYDVLLTSQGKRKQPLMCVISTQSPNPSNVLSELLDYGARVRSGEIDDPTFHADLYTVDETLDPWEEKNWHLANPGLGIIRSLEEMRQEAKRAQRMPSFQASFENLYLNRRVDAEPKAILPMEWEACGGDLDIKALRGRPCWAGLDLSATRDMTALVLYFRDDGGAVVSHFWLPKDGIAEKQELDRVPYRSWADAGHITLTPGAAINKSFIVSHLAEIAGLYDVQAIAYDRWGTAELQRIMGEEGVKLPLVEHGQGFRDMGTSTSAFEAAMLDRRLKHGGNPVLRWQSTNLVYERDPAGNRKPAKNRAIDRIDGMAALIMAIGTSVKSAPKRRSIYAQRGLVSVSV